jgi:hypothetical protein
LNPKKKEHIQSRKQTIRLIDIVQTRCGLSGINDEKNADTAVKRRRVVVIGFSTTGPGVGGGGG